jgi:hypothetical protein
MSTRRTSRRIAYRLRNPKSKTKARKRIIRRRNQSYPEAYLNAVYDYLTMETSVADPTEEEVKAVADYLYNENAQLETAQDGDDLAEMIFDLYGSPDDSDYSDYLEGLTKAIRRVQPEEEEEEFTEEEEEISVEEEPQPTTEKKKTLTLTFGGEGAKPTLFSAPASGTPKPSTITVPKTPSSTPPPREGERGSGIYSSTTRTTSDRTTSKASAESAGMKTEYEMTPYDELRLSRFKSRSKKVQTELGLFFFYLELRKRTLPLPSVAAFDVAMRANASVLPKGFPIGDYYAEEYRQNAFVVYRADNGNTQLFIPSVNPIAVESARRIPVSRAKRKKLQIP